MNAKTSVVSPAADCGKPQPIRSVGSSVRSHGEQEYFMFSPKARFIFLVAAAAVVALGAVASTASANMITNGDFSANASAYASEPGYNGSGANPVEPTGWSSTAPAVYGGVGVNGTDTATAVGNVFAPGPSDNILPPASCTGSQDFGFLQGGLTTTTSGILSPAVYSQGFATALGEKYVVTFDAAQRGFDSNQGRDDTFVQLQVQIADANNNVLASANSFTGGGLTITDSSWTGNALNFTADATSATLTFADAPNSAPGETVDFTNVNVAAVPEPSVLGLLASGGVVGLLMLKRRSMA